METVLITGASSGIGCELAKVYAKNNYDLVLVGRRIERLKQLKSEIKKSNPKIQVKVIEIITRRLISFVEKGKYKNRYFNK